MKFMNSLVMISLIWTFTLFLLVNTEETTDQTPNNDSGQQFKVILALIVAVVLIITILIIVIIILFALSGKNKQKHEDKFNKLNQFPKSKTPKRKVKKGEAEKDDNNMVFVAKGQSDEEKAKNDPLVSGSFVFSDKTKDSGKEETYATALQNTGASESMAQRPTDLNYKNVFKSKSKSVVIKDNNSKK